MRANLERYLAEIVINHQYYNRLNYPREPEKQKEFSSVASDSKTSRAYLGTTPPNLKDNATRSWESILACFIVKTTDRYENKTTYDDKNKQIRNLPDSDWFFSEVEDDKNIRLIAYKYLTEINLGECLNQMGKNTRVEAKIKKMSHV